MSLYSPFFSGFVETKFNVPDAFADKRVCEKDVALVRTREDASSPRWLNEVSSRKMTALATKKTATAMPMIRPTPFRSKIDDPSS